MTVQEAARIVQLVHTAYPVDRKATAEDLADRIDLWSVFFADYDGELVMKVVKAWIKAYSFMPTVEEIKKHCDTHRKLMAQIANAGFIDQVKVTPEQEEMLDALFESIEGEDDE